MEKLKQILTEIAPVINFTEIESQAGINRGALRYFIRGERNLSRTNRFKLLRWFAEMKNDLKF